MMSFTVGGQRGWLALVLALGLTFALPARLQAAPDARELQAREDFAAGRYQTALEIFARLYAETLHPNYLRNIGRCYQNLGEADHAIASFRDYLRKGQTISAAEHAEIEGYIEEMQSLKRYGPGPVDSPVTEAARPPSAAKSTTAPVPAAPAPPRPPRAASLTLVAPPPAPPRDASPPIYERWWFWAVVAGAVGAGLGVAAAAGAFRHYDDASCRSGFNCQ